MALLRSLWPKKGPAKFGPLDDGGDWLGRSRLPAHGPVTQDVALKLSAVWRCAAILAGSVAGLPFPVYKRRADGGKDRWPKHPIYALLHDKPNAWQTSFEWRELGMYSLLFRGDFYNWIRPGPRGLVDQLWPIDPDRVTPEQLEDGTITYHVRVSDGTEIVLTDDEVFHVLGPSRDGGVTGMGVLDVAAEAFRAGLTQEQFAARFFTQSPNPGGVLQHPGRLQPEAKENLKQEWQAATSGENAGKTAVLEHGIDWKPFQIGLTAEQSQLIEARDFTVQDVARWFGVPNHLVGAEVASSWGTGIEQMGVGFLTYTLLTWLRRFETRANTDLILASDTYFAEFLVDGLLRGDAKTRSEALAVQRSWGVLTANEWRAIENRNPVPGGDSLLAPLNMGTVAPDGTIVPATPPAAAAGPPSEPSETEQDEGAPRSPNGVAVGV